jgi:hypothetical protein
MQARFRLGSLAPARASCPSQPDIEMLTALKADILSQSRRDIEFRSEDRIDISSWIGFDFRIND